MVEAARAANTTVVTQAFHQFAPQGVSGVVVIEESHLSIHTWPEAGYAAVDFFTCGDGTPELAHEVLRTGLNADRSEVMKVDRGTYPPGPSMHVKHHYREGRESPDAAFLSETIVPEATAAKTTAPNQ